MKFTTVAILLFVMSVQAVSAYQLFETEVSTPYDIVPVLSDINSKQVYLGNLENFPIMYEFVVEESTDMKLGLKQKFNNSGDPTRFGLLVVKVEPGDRGVSEVARFNSTPDNWQVLKDKNLGLTFWSSEEFEQSIDPGTYRVEVSTPDNIGKYILEIGDIDDSNGYFESLGQARTTQKFFGYSMFKLLTSSLVYYPLGIILLGLVIQRTWKYRKLISNVN